MAKAERRGGVTNPCVTRASIRAWAFEIQLPICAACTLRCMVRCMILRSPSASIGAHKRERKDDGSKWLFVALTTALLCLPFTHMTQPWRFRTARSTLDIESSLNNRAIPGIVHYINHVEVQSPQKALAYHIPHTRKPVKYDLVQLHHVQNHVMEV
jgi:hypothetical protein|eukprot:SAG25_NODE_88_length_16343_cov_89.495383_15_plen_156_part_00